MRRIFVTIAWLSLTIGCKSKSQEHRETLIKAQESPAVYDLEAMSEAEKTSYTNRLQGFFDSNLNKRGFNGAILVAKGGHVLYETYIGYKNPAIKTDSIDKNTAFHLASTSKPFTAAAIFKLIQDGKVSLQDELTRFFPAFPYPGVTVENLLTHRSGLPNYLYVMEDKKKWDPKQMISNQDVLYFLEKFKPPVNTRPGSHFSYCNTNFVLLALIVEKVSGQSFPNFMKENIFDPLMMHHTFVYQPSDSGRVIMSYKASGALWANDIFENTYGDKNIYSTAEDMFKWDRALYNPNFIRPSLLDSAFQPYSHEKPSIHNYGLGWRMLNLPNGKHVVYHNGKWHGFTPAFARLTDEKAVVIILGNKLNANIYNSARKAYDIFGNYLQSTPSREDESEGRLPAASAPIPAPKATKVARVAPKSTPVKTAKKSSTNPTRPKAATKPTTKKTSQPVSKKTVKPVANKKAVPPKKTTKKK